MREQAFPFCLASSERRLQQHGRQNLHDLKVLASSASQVTCCWRSDVSIFAIDVPPMALAKLKAALPNLLEEQALTDPSELYFATAEIGTDVSPRRRSKDMDGGAVSCSAGSRASQIGRLPDLAWFTAGSR